MKPLPVTPELCAVARRVMWFEEPERALAQPVQFLAHVMVFGGVEDLKALRGVVRRMITVTRSKMPRREFSTPGRGRTGI